MLRSFKNLPAGVQCYFSNPNYWHSHIHFIFGYRFIFLYFYYFSFNYIKDLTWLLRKCPWLQMNQTPIAHTAMTDRINHRQLSVRKIWNCNYRWWKRGREKQQIKTRRMSDKRDKRTAEGILKGRSYCHCVQWLPSVKLMGLCSVYVSHISLLILKISLRIIFCIIVCHK